MITGKTRLTGLLGWPVGQTKSPRLHNHWLKHHGIDGVFVPLPVAPTDLAAVVQVMPRMGFIGFNVTVPHKQAMLGLVDRLDPLAASIGAVNCVLVGENGGLEGRNTDAAGFMANLREARPDFAADAGPVALLGAGGGARAAAAALISAGAKEIRLINRSRGKAEELAAAMGPVVRPVDWAQRHEALAGAALLINSTSLGMNGQPPLDLALDDLPKSALVNDLVYAPLDTELLQTARRRGNDVADGLGMLLNQAVPAFATWWGVTPELTPAIRQMMLAP